MYALPSLGLPRVVPPGGFTVDGHWLPEGVSIEQSSHRTSVSTLPSFPQFSAQPPNPSETLIPHTSNPIDLSLRLLLCWVPLPHQISLRPRHLPTPPLSTSESPSLLEPGVQPLLSWSPQMYRSQSRVFGDAPCARTIAVGIRSGVEGGRKVGVANSKDVDFVGEEGVRGYDLE